MHVRVLLSRYRSYTECPACNGARLKPESLLWRLSGRTTCRTWRCCPWHAAASSSRSCACRHRSTEADDAAAGRDPRAAGLSVRGGPGLPHAGPAVAHAVGRRGPAHQPDHGAGHLAGEHAVRARRAFHRPASARHGPRDRRDAEAARCRQHAGGGGARSADHVRGRPLHRHGTRRGRARRRASSSTARRAADRCMRRDRSPAIILPAGAASKPREPAGNGETCRRNSWRCTAPACTTCGTPR